MTAISFVNVNYFIVGGVYGHLLEISALCSIKGQTEFTVCLVLENAVMKELFCRKREEITGMETNT